MISDSDYQELRSVMFDFKNSYPDLGDFLLVYNTLSEKPIFKKLKGVGLADALNKIDNEYQAITLAALDLKEALQYILGWRPKNWDAEKARDLGRAALAKAGIIIEERMNETDYWHYVLCNGFIESGWEYFDDAQDRFAELKEAGIYSVVLLKDKLDLDPWNNNNWRNAQ